MQAQVGQRVTVVCRSGVSAKQDLDGDLGVQRGESEAVREQSIERVKGKRGFRSDGTRATLFKQTPDRRSGEGHGTAPGSNSSASAVAHVTNRQVHAIILTIESLIVAFFEWCAQQTPESRAVSFREAATRWPELKSTDDRRPM